MQDDEVTSDRVQGSVLEPCRVAVDVKMKGATGDFNLSLSDLRLNLAPDIVELVQRLQSSVLEPLVQPAPDRSVPQHRVCMPQSQLPALLVFVDWWCPLDWLLHTVLALC